MNKFTVLLVSMLITSLSPMAFAGPNYSCVGKAGAAYGEATITIAFDGLNQAKVTDFEGAQYILGLNKSETKANVFADYGYDGYGGSVELTIPKNVQLSGSNVTEEFEVKFQVETYSEIGHALSMTYLGNCQRRSF